MAIMKRKKKVVEDTEPKAQQSSLTQRNALKEKKGKK
jgi:hypothetical protein